MNNRSKMVIPAFYLCLDLRNFAGPLHSYRMNPSVFEDDEVCQEFHSSVFDAIPSAIFVVNTDLSIKDFNDAAIQLPDDVLGITVAPDWEGDRIGDVLGCVHATAGCGNSPHCEECGFVDCVQQTAEGKPSRKLLSVTHRKNGCLVPVEYLVTSAPLLHGAELMTLIILDSRENWSILQD